MKILTSWLRHYLPALSVSDRQLADDLTLRGIAVEGVHTLGPDNGHLFEMDITTNRVDAMNHYGIAREAATIYDLPLAPLDTELPAATPANPFPVRIADDARNLCGRFTAQVIRNVNIAPSTTQVAHFFDLLGQKQISNAVDASNFTLLGMGHPTHAFDLDKIEGGIVVRLARPGEKLKLLDGTDRTLEAEDLVVADEKKALALAGVMGGWDSMITAETRNVLVEAAWFDPASIRRSSRRHLLHTDASHRFERGADFNAAPLANALVCDLILASGGYLEGELIDLIHPATQQRTAARAPIALSLGEVQRHLGTTLDDSPGRSALTADLVDQYLTALGCILVAAPHSAASSSGLASTSDFSVTLPSWRLDLEREIDLIEEIARVFGYNRFANTLPAPRPVLAHATAPQARALRARLLALGFTEAISSTFASVAESSSFAAPALRPSAEDSPSLQHVVMENPLSEEASLLRPSLLPGMLSMLANNLNRDVREVRLFEQGEIFAGTVLADDSTIDSVVETPSLVLGLTSAHTAATPLHNATDAPIFELKGAIESLVSLFQLPGGSESLSFTTESLPSWLEPGRGGAALLHGRPFALFGELAVSLAAPRKLRQPVFLAAVAVEELLVLPLRKHTARELSRFQAVIRDLSFLFPDTLQWHTVSAAIHALALPDLESLSPLEIFRDRKGRSIPAGDYSLLFRMVFQSPVRTLTEADLQGSAARVIEALTALGGRHRAPDEAAHAS